MKKIMTITIAAAMVAAMAGTVSAEEAVVAGNIEEVPDTSVSVTLDFASAYVFRGYTFNDSTVFQPGIEASGLGLPEKFGSATVGAWGNVNFNDYNGSDYASQFSEIDWYGSYSLPTLLEGVDLFVGYTEYTYPGAAPADADKEVNAGAGFEIAGVALGATVYQLVGGAYTGDTWYEASAGYGFDLSEGLALGLAADVRFVDSDGGESGFNDYTLGADISYALTDTWSVGISATYIGQGDDSVLVDGKGAYDVDFVGVLSLAGAF